MCHINDINVVSLSSIKVVFTVSNLTLRSACLDGSKPLVPFANQMSQLNTVSCLDQLILTYFLRPIRRVLANINFATC